MIDSPFAADGQGDGRGTFTRRGLINRVGLAAGAMAVIPGVAACGSSSSSGSGASGGGTLRIGHTSQIDSLNPFASVQTISTTVLQASFPFLVGQSGPTDPITPNFASSWSTSPDALTMTLKVKHGGKWTDGKPLTAEDAAFTLNMIVKFQTGPTGLLGSFVTGISSAKATDPETLVISFQHPTAPALANLAFIPILPKHIWAPLATGDGSKISTFQVGVNAVSCGAYHLTKYETNEIAIVERYPGTYGPRGHADALGWMQEQADASLIQAMSQSELDALVQTSDIPLGLTSLKPPTFKVQYAPGQLWYEISFNCNAKKPQHRELLNPKVRTALAHATNKDAIVSDVLFKKAQPGSSIVPPAQGKWNNPSIKPETFDIDLANHMLDQLGYKRGSGGIRVADGAQMSYTMNVSTDITPYDRVFQIVADGWSKAGVNINLKALDTDAMVAATTAPDFKYLTPDVNMWDFAGEPDPQFILGVLTTGQIGAYSDTAFSNPSYDHLFVQQAQETDETKRIDLVHQMQQIAYDEKPYIVLCYVNAYGVTAEPWTGLVLTPNGLIPQSSNQWAINAKHA